MELTAKLVSAGDSLVVCLPDGYRFPGTEVNIRRNKETGEVVLSCKPFDWDEFFALCDSTPIPPDFLSDEERHKGSYPADPLTSFGK